MSLTCDAQPGLKIHFHKFLMKHFTIDCVCISKMIYIISRNWVFEILKYFSINSTRNKIFMNTKKHRM